MNSFIERLLMEFIVFVLALLISVIIESLLLSISQIVKLLLDQLWIVAAFGVWRLGLVGVLSMLIILEQLFEILCSIDVTRIVFLVGRRLPYSLCLILWLNWLSQTLTWNREVIGADALGRLLHLLLHLERLQHWLLILSDWICVHLWIWWLQKLAAEQSTCVKITQIMRILPVIDVNVTRLVV